MTENPQTDASEAPRSEGQETTPEPTGHPVVDEVLASMTDLQDRPVEEHVAVFEAAHERLRAALTDAGDRAAPSGS